MHHHFLLKYIVVEVKQIIAILQQNRKPDSPFSEKEAQYLIHNKLFSYHHSILPFPTRNPTITHA